MGDHFVDALRYALSAVPRPTIKGDFPAPPPIPEGLTPEQHAAHLMLHDLLSVEEFEAEREKPGFVAINAHWGANGKRRFCCERPIAHEPPARGPAWGQMASWLDKK